MLVKDLRKKKDILVGTSKPSPSAIFTFSQKTFQTLPNSKSLQTTILKLMKMAGISQNGYKTMWEKEKLLKGSLPREHIVSVPCARPGGSVVSVSGS